MSRDPYETLGLPRIAADERTIERRFRELRASLLRDLESPETRAAASARLDEVYLARAALRRGAPPDESAARAERLRALAEASLEGGLLRHSRRERLLAEGRRLGFSEFQTHLLIAQVLYGEVAVLPRTARAEGAVRDRVARQTARLAASALLGLAMFLAMVRWLGV